ncbi:MAG: hypothetical protein NTNFB02_16340 [Nitrospira sp.]
MIGGRFGKLLGLFPTHISLDWCDHVQAAASRRPEKAYEAELREQAFHQLRRLDDACPRQ